MSYYYFVNVVIKTFLLLLIYEHLHVYYYYYCYVKLWRPILLGTGHYLSARGGGGAGQFFGNPIISSSTPLPNFYFEVDPPTPQQQQQTVCNADPPPLNGPSLLFSQQIITLEIPNGFQNVIKHKTDKKRWDNDIIKSRKENK